MIPRKKTLSNMRYKNIPKYEYFFQVFYKHLLTTHHQKELKEFVANAKRDSTQTLLADFNDGYCPRKWEALKYVPYVVILLNFHEYKDEYEKVVQNIKLGHV
jgi:hypothetical protein